MQDMLEVVDSHRLLRVEDDKVVAVSLVVAEEEVLAVLRPILAPILSGNLNGGGLGVLVPRVAYAVLVEPTEYFITSFHMSNAKIKRSKIVKSCDFLSRVAYFDVDGCCSRSVIMTPKVVKLWLMVLHKSNKLSNFVGIIGKSQRKT